MMKNDLKWLALADWVDDKAVDYLCEQWLGTFKNIGSSAPFLVVINR